jgi:hypothetical protein
VTSLPADRSPSISAPAHNKRRTERHSVVLPARLTWKDRRGSTRFATVIARDVSEHGVYVECQSPISIPLFRLVHVQLERDARDTQGLPWSLRQGRVLSAVYRVDPPTRSGARQGIALRLMVDPRRQAAADTQPAGEVGSCNDVVNGSNHGVHGADARSRNYWGAPNRSAATSADSTVSAAAS